LKEVQQARNHESKVERQQLKALLAIAEKYSPVIKLPERLEESFATLMPETVNL
jgi:hypothetical protein